MSQIDPLGKSKLTVRSQNEVGRILGISGGRVHQIEKQALAKLRKYLQEQEAATDDEHRLS